MFPCILVHPEKVVADHELLNSDKLTLPCNY